MKQKFEKRCAFQDYINEYLNSGAEVALLARDVEGKKKASSFTSSHMSDNFVD